MKKYGLFSGYDITFCKNKVCPHRAYCLRAKIPSDGEWISVSTFQLNPDGSCDMIMDDKRR